MPRIILSRKEPEGEGSKRGRRGSDSQPGKQRSTSKHEQRAAGGKEAWEKGSEGEIEGRRRANKVECLVFLFFQGEVDIQAALDTRQKLHCNRLIQHSVVWKGGRDGGEVGREHAEQ